MRQRVAAAWDSLTTLLDQRRAVRQLMQARLASREAKMRRRTKFTLDSATRKGVLHWARDEGFVAAQREKHGAVLSEILALLTRLDMILHRFPATADYPAGANFPGAAEW